jgi:hypothetical protein
MIITEHKPVFGIVCDIFVCVGFCLSPISFLLMGEENHVLIFYMNIYMYIEYTVTYFLVNATVTDFSELLDRFIQ